MLGFALEQTAPGLYHDALCYPVSSVRRKLVITLSTVHGTRQITLSQVARYLVILLLLVAAGAFVLSNYLLVRTSESLEMLESEHQLLSDERDMLSESLDELTSERDLLQRQYDVVAGTQRVYLNELDQLNTRLKSMSSERALLAEKNEQMSEELTQLNAIQTEADQLQVEREALVDQNEILTERLTDLEATLGLATANSNLSVRERADLLEAEAKERLFLLHSIPNGMPADSSRVTDGYGPRKHPITGKNSFHQGIDLKLVVGTPVYATAEGIVESAGYDKNGGFGKVIRIQHSFGFRTYYAHLSKIQVKSGSYVTKGQQIGLSGNTGRSTGPHLHYEVRRLWTPLNPEPFIHWSLNDYDGLFASLKEVDWESLGKLYQLRGVTVPSQ